MGNFDFQDLILKYFGQKPDLIKNCGYFFIKITVLITGILHLIQV